VGEAEIAARLSGRRCGTCGALYHARNRPPREAGRCDACGGLLRRRADDAPEAIAERMRVYRAQTAPLIDRYERAGLLRTVDGGGRPEEVFERIADLLPVLKG
jgi:adenylate kinase